MRLTILVLLLAFTGSTLHAQEAPEAKAPKLAVKKKEKGKRTRAGAERPKSRHKLKLGAQAGAGFDSNMLNKPAEAKGAALVDLGLRASYRYRAHRALTLRTGAKLGLAYRRADSETSGLKLKPSFKLGLRWRLFGGGKGKRFRPMGTLGLDGSYTGIFTPSLASPPATPVDPDVCDPGHPSYNPDLCAQEEVEDSLEGELVDSADAEESEEADSAEDDEDASDEVEESEETEEDEAEAEAEEDASEAADEQFGDSLGGALFTSTPPRHVIGGTLSFALKPLANTTIRLSAKGGATKVGDVEGKPSSSFHQVGGRLRLQQKLFRRLVLSAGYGLGYQLYDEKRVGTAPDDHPYRGLAHTISVGAKLKLLRRLKLKTGYSLGLRSVSGEPRLASRTHQIRLGVGVKLVKGLSVFLENSLLFVQMTEQTDKDRSRYQGLLGVRYVY